MSQSNVANIHPKRSVCGRLLVLQATLDKVPEPLVGCVDRVEGVQVVHDGSEDKGRVDRSDVEVGLLVFNEVPCSLLRKCLGPQLVLVQYNTGALTYLATPVHLGMVQGLFPSDRVPVLFTIDRRMLLGVDNGGERRSDDDPLHSRGVGLDRLQDSSRSLDGGVQEVLNGVLDIEVERRCCVEDIVEWRVRFNSL